MSKISFLSSLLAFSLLFGACSSQNSDKKAEHQTDQTTDKIVSKDTITLHSIDNKEYTVKKSDSGFKLENSKAKILILDIFATWCPPCQAEAPHLSTLQKKYQDDIKIIGITIEDNIPNTNLEAFKQAHKADYTLVNSAANRRVVNELAKDLKLGNNFGIPLLVIYKDGKLVQYYQGAVEEEFIESDIKRALGI